MEAAIEVAKLSGGSVTALNVVDPSAIAIGRDMYDDIATIMGEEAKDDVEYVRKRCAEAGVPVTTKIVEGHPAEVIVQLSKDYDLIVMSTIGKAGVTKFLIGSVAEKVVRMAHCKVMTVRVGS